LTFTPADELKKALIDTTCDMTVNANNDSPNEKYSSWSQIHNHRSSISVPAKK
jgi:hypothetical protein